MKITKIIVHHFGGVESNLYAKSAHVTFAQIDRAHYNRWPDFKSQLGFWVGYQFIINADGTWKQARLVGEEGAHTKGSNSDSVGICLAGNFSLGYNGKPVEEPTDAQKKTLQDLVSALVENKHFATGIILHKDVILDLSFTRVFPHRYYQSNTDCYGRYLDTMWARRLMADYIDVKLGLMASLLESLVDTYYKFINIRKSLGGRKQSCQDINVRD